VTSYRAAGVRRARRSPQTKVNASIAAAAASLFPMDLELARLTAVSRASLAKAAEFHRPTSPARPEAEAATVPRPSTRSLIPIVLMSNTEAPVGSSLPDRRIGALGATRRAAPTDARSHPIVWLSNGTTRA